MSERRTDLALFTAALSIGLDSTMLSTAFGLRLYADCFRLVRNFPLASSISPPFDISSKPMPKGRSVVEIERDGRIGIDLKFGSITFEEEERGTFAVALVDVIVAAADMAPESDTRVQMNVRIAADPEKDSVLGLTEAFRNHIVKTLRAAADTLDETSARALLFYRPETEAA